MMGNCPFCNLDSAPNSDTGKRPGGFLRRAFRGIQWLFPAAILVLMPKCPLCVVAYVALFTGIGIGVATARWIQIGMLAICFASLVYLTVRCLRRRSDSRGSTASL